MLRPSLFAVALISSSLVVIPTIGCGLGGPARDYNFTASPQKLTICPPTDGVDYPWQATTVTVHPTGGAVANGELDDVTITATAVDPGLKLSVDTEPKNQELNPDYEWSETTWEGQSLTIVVEVTRKPAVGAVLRFSLRVKGDLNGVLIDSLAGNDGVDFDFELTVGCAQQQVVYASDRDGDFEIFVTNEEGSHTQLTDNGVFDGDPAWSADRKRIAFVSNRTGSANIHTMHPDGDNVAQVTAHGPGDSATDPAWAPDDARLAYIHYEGANSQLVLRTVRAAGGGGLELLRVGAQQSLSRPTWSSGDRITFALDGGIYDIAVDGSETTPRPVQDALGIVERDANRGRLDELVFVQSGEDADDTGIFRMTEAGPERVLLPGPQVTLSHPALDGTGGRIVYVRRDEMASIDLWRIYTANIDGSDPRQIPGQAGTCIAPDW